MNSKKANRWMKLRLTIIAGLFIAVMVWFVVTISGLQINEGDSIRQAVEAEAAVTVKTVKTDTSRGAIYDSRGVSLVHSELTYGVEMQYANWDRSRGNRTLLTALTILKQHGHLYTDSLPLTGGAFATYTVQDDETLKKFIEAREWDADISAQELYTKLQDRYGIPNDFSPEEVRMVVGMRYDLEVKSFSPLIPIPLASNVDRQTVVELRSQDLPGVEIVTEEKRVYDTNLMAHILGRMGYIPPEDADYYASLGYSSGDKVGLFGIEKAYETDLCGTEGSVLRTYDEDGRLLGEVTETEAAPGDDVYLTIDLRIQKAAEESLAARIEAMRAAGGTGSKAEGGAAVAVEVGTGRILAEASYPTYNLATFSQDYQALLQAEYGPMFNRAASGVYAPGSIFKMVTATAALQDGVIDTSTRIQDKGVYDYYAPNYLYHCWIYNDYHRTHGYLNVAGALQNSCNYFFYEMGRLLGIDRIDYYASLYGLGQPTGIEIGETVGVIAGPEERGSNWYPGDTLMAAIGQSDNAFTPVQMANYVATICSGGKRYEAHLVDTVIASNGDLVEEKVPKEVADVGLSSENLSAILDGMRRVTEDGTASRVFSDYSVSVIGKTGSAQVQGGEANGVFVLAAPAENPEIAIAVVVEHGGSGNNVAWIARDILDAYMATK